MLTRRRGRRHGNGGVEDPSEGDVGGVAAANMPPRDDPAVSPQRQTNLSGRLSRMTRHCAKALANIGGKKGGSNAPLGENTSEDVSVAAGARGAQSNAPIATADAPAARRLQITQPDEFPTSRPARRTINNMNPETFEDGYDSEGDLPFAPDYDSDSDDDGYEGLGVVCVDEPLSEEEGGEGDEEEKKGKQHPKLTKEQVEKIAEEGGGSPSNGIPGGEGADHLWFEGGENA